MNIQHAPFGVQEEISLPSHVEFINNQFIAFGNNITAIHIHNIVKNEFSFVENRFFFHPCYTGHLFIQDLYFPLR